MILSYKNMHDHIAPLLIPPLIFMGGNLSTHHDKPTPTLKKEHTNESLSVPFMELLKPACMKIEKRKKKMMMKNNKNKDGNQGKLTLEDWLFSSSDHRECLKINAVHVRKHSLKVLPVSSSPVESYVRVVNSTPRESFSIDEGGEIASVSQMNGSQSGLAKKRVTFKLPDMADIFVYHVPGDEEVQLPV
ncbi:hypothetical protein J5N97_005352 [Dioscorea zingiberensis]|uniref:Uncharacterized protein n=1 Tax=Dioscorea zingiberensis TaxID=325984 RepID=A0A9D5D8F3_9LILI|nr:hypothetical protein J5N97_005352 [Dioscorea zingiberensis]